jgi:hypothetical protein
MRISPREEPVESGLETCRVIVINAWLKLPIARRLKRPDIMLDEDILVPGGIHLA